MTTCVVLRESISLHGRWRIFVRGETKIKDKSKIVKEGN